MDIDVTVTDGTDPINGAAVTLTDKTDNTKTFTGTTDATGECTIEEVPLGTYVVTATATGFENYTGSSDFEVEEDTDSLEIEMTAEVTTTDIAVTVTDGTDPVQGASVTLTDTTDSEITKTGTSGSAGGCTLSNVAFGTYTVTASCEGYENYTGAESLVVTAETTTLAIQLTAATQSEEPQGEGSG